MRPIFVLIATALLPLIAHTYTPSISSRRTFIERARGVLVGSASLAILPEASRAENGYSTAILAEPSEDFKKSEAQRASFRAAQLKLKAEFTSSLSHLTSSPPTSSSAVQDLEKLKSLVINDGGLPEGIKWDDLKKTIRKVKRDGDGKYWTTEVELAYQALNREIAFQQNPNKDKEMGNPMS